MRYLSAADWMLDSVSVASTSCTSLERFEWGRSFDRMARRPRVSLIV